MSEPRTSYTPTSWTITEKHPWLSFPFLFLLHLFIYLTCVCVHARVYYCRHVDVGGQPAGVGLLLLQGLNPDSQAWKQA